MRKDFRFNLALCSFFLLAAAEAQENRHQWSLEIELDARTTDDSKKLAAAGDSDFARVAFVYSGEIAPTVTVNAVVDAVDDGSSGIDVTEAFLAWHPVPKSPFRHRIRVGAFYPPLSLENVEADWTSPYTRSFSAINTWICEELRTIGTEWSVSRALGPRASQRELRLIAAGYYGNDPAGTILAWRGWALHERQSRLDDALLLPPVPQIQPGMMFDKQAPATEPFVETDHSPGVYYGAHWEFGRRIVVTAMRYDNRADPETIRHGHYGWQTKFDHLGAQFQLPAGLGLILQWLDGTTVMGPVMNGAHVVDNGIDSYFALLTRKYDRQRWTVRFDNFGVTDRDTTPMDDNTESGHALTAAWRFEPDRDWSIGVEWRAVNVTRPANAYFAIPLSSSDKLVNFDIRYRLSSQTRRP